MQTVCAQATGRIYPSSPTVKPTYCLLAGTLGHGYAAVDGDGDRLEGDFAVDPTDVTAAIERLEDA